jgi:hypothetical protein
LISKENMKRQNQKLADVRKALSSQQILPMRAVALQGGARAAIDSPRWAFPFVVDTDRPG